MRHIDAVTHDHQANQVAPNKNAKVGAFWGLHRLRAPLKTCCSVFTTYQYVGSDWTNNIFVLQEMCLLSREEPKKYAPTFCRQKYTY
jgi:hypothetical protein